jgi:hypothetical protein
VDEPDPARRARARAADYDGWLAEAKAKWRTLRKKMAVLRNFVKTERDGGGGGGDGGLGRVGVGV